MNAQFKVFIAACGLLGLGMLLQLAIASRGLSATAIVFGISAVLLIAWLNHVYRQEKRVPVQLFRALANGDHTLGLPDDHPLRRDFRDAQTQMQAAQLAAEQQIQFINAVFNHMDLAMLICDEYGQITEQSAAVRKQLGLKIDHIDAIASNNPQIIEFIKNTHKHSRQTFSWQKHGLHDTLYIQVSTLRIQTKLYKVVTLQSIKEELNAKEQHAYKQLTKVLTHEVANSITPLTSMAQTCISLLPDALSFDEEEDKQDLHLALSTLASRSAHLSEFIQEFRKLSSLPAPQLAKIELSELLKNTKQLFCMQHNEVAFDIVAPPNALCVLDTKQIEQVLINLCKNAVEALQISAQTNPKITLKIVKNEEDKLCVDVIDNGPGITQQAQDMMFVPFYTTKQQGSGIGLSLSRQIMLQHGGELLYLDQPQGACFRCVFG
ncbi:ATP-binding protein [Pseudoalteromonas sp. SMS1]|uniref:sensor histidine kinase n=1 Tax=Pseudoalteromonas sp. SMS1 TaxID=2908894 RepID=UPI001F3586D7|nr:ATP-binding protein [Pseudoalteromonas sp. SMS1]MCF2858470.1 ATP-binding protein [Pseudoalteromonas sp. SMS1]